VVLFDDGEGRFVVLTEVVSLGLQQQEDVVSGDM